MRNSTLFTSSALVGCLLVAGTSARAQDAAPKAPPAAAIAPNLDKKTQAIAVEEMPLRDVLAKLSEQTGVKIVVDSASGAKPVTLNLPAGTLVQTMKQIAKQAGTGIQARFVALPVGASLPTGDAVSSALIAQDALKPLKVPGTEPAALAPRVKQAASPEGNLVSTDAAEAAIEVAGRPVALVNAPPLLAALNLTPVYVVMNPTGDNPIARSARLQAEGLQVWLGMTPEQRKQAAEAQFNGLLSMDPPTRRALFGQMMEQAQGIGQKIMSLPEDQRKQFLSDVTGGRFDGTTLPAPAPPSGNN